MKYQILQQELYVPRPRMVCTTARPVTCMECGRGLDAGYGIRARRIEGKTVMLCDVHYSQHQ